MKYAALILVIFAVFGKGSSQLTFDQIVDHSDPISSGTFEQRYWQRTFGTDPPSVGFLMISGEIADTDPLLGAWMEYAQQLSDDGTGIVCLELEHRYYGNSQPSTSPFEFLSSNQALDDISYFLSRMSASYSDNLKWVVFGGSYAGTLAAWARQTFPDLIHAAVASSAPLEAIADFSGYLEVVRKSLASVDPSCPKLVTQLAEQQRDIGFMTKIMILVQYGNQVKACELAQCAASGSDSQSCQRSIRLQSKDLPSYCRFHQNNSFVPGRGFYGSGWTKQICSEFGWFQTSETTSSLFGNLLPLSLYVDTQCSGDYEDVNEGIDAINAEHRGKNFSTERVLLIHGSLDPWSAAGVH